MRKKIFGKYKKSYNSIFIEGFMMLTACGQAADDLDHETPPTVSPFTEEEIADRIRHVGRRYDGLDDSYGLFSGGGINYATNGGMVMTEACFDE